MLFTDLLNSLRVQTDVIAFGGDAGERALARSILVQATLELEKIVEVVDDRDVIVWPNPNGNGWIDAWNGWYATEPEARECAAMGDLDRRSLDPGEGLITYDEQERRLARLRAHGVTA